MILILIAALILYVGVPAGLVLGSVVAIPIGVVSAGASLIAGAPGVAAGARLTASPGRTRRAAGWLLLAACSVVGPGAALVAVVAFALVSGAILALPNVLPFTP